MSNEFGNSRKKAQKAQKEWEGVRRRAQRVYADIKRIPGHLVSAPKGQQISLTPKSLNQKKPPYV
jgi:hypothetical protein